MNDEARRPTGDGESVWSFDYLELFRASTFGFRHFAAAERLRSHMLDYVVSELGALDLGGAVHQACEIIRDTFAFDRAAQSFENQVRNFSPPHVTEHHFTGKNYRAGIYFVQVRVFRCGAMCSLENSVAGDVIDISSGRDADATHLRGERVAQVIAIQIERGDDIEIFRSRQHLLKRDVGNGVFDNKSRTRFSHRDSAPRSSIEFLRAK